MKGKKCGHKGGPKQKKAYMAGGGPVLGGPGKMPTAPVKGPMPGAGRGAQMPAARVPRAGRKV